MMSKQLVAMLVYSTVLGAVLGVCGISVLHEPLVFFLFDIPLLYVGYIAIKRIFV